MAELTLDVARKILDAALAKAVEKKFKPWSSRFSMRAVR